MDQNEKSVPNHETPKQETSEPKMLASALARMRAGVIPPHQRDEELLAYLADQIEAASRHDLAVVAARSALNAVRLTNEKWERKITVAQNATISGNAAALRSALKDTQDLLKHFTRNGGMLADAFALHMRDNDAALAAPARNCDCWEHWEEAWAYFCPKYCKKNQQ